MRQHELNVEGKWGTDDTFFRLFYTLLGMTTVDTMLAVKAESHPGHAVRKMGTNVFTESMCEELLRNKLDGKIYDPNRSTARRARPVNGPAADTEETDGEEHVLRSYDRKSDYHPDIARASKADYRIQSPCVMCGKKTGTYCSRSGCKLMHKRELSSPCVWHWKARVHGQARAQPDDRGGESEGSCYCSWRVKVPPPDCLRAPRWVAGVWGVEQRTFVLGLGHEPRATIPKTTSHK